MTLRKMSLLIAVGAAALFSALYLFEGFNFAEERIYDFFLRFRPRRERLDQVVFLDVDDRAVAHVGVFPWPRSVMADAYLRLKEYGALQAIMDIEYIDKGPPGVDAVYLNRGLPSDFNESFAGIASDVADLFGAINSGYLSGPEAEAYAGELGGMISGERDELLKKAAAVARDNDLYLAQAAALYGRVWGTVNLQSNTLTGEQAERQPRAAERFSYPVTAAAGAVHEPYVNVLAPIPSFMNAIEGAGFTNVHIDLDGVRRRIFLAHQIEGTWYLQLAFAPLIHQLGSPAIEIQHGRMIIRGARLPATNVSTAAVRDIVIPLGRFGKTKGTMLLDWPLTDYGDSYEHVSFANFSLLEEYESNVEQHLLNLAQADPGFLAAAGGNLSLLVPQVDNARNLLALAAEARARALEQCSDDAFNEYVDAKNQAWRIVEKLIDPALSADAETAGGALAREYPDQAGAIAAEVQFLTGTLAALKTSYGMMQEDADYIRSTVAGKYCIAGRSDTGTTDIGVNPFWGRYVNVGTHGVVLDTILSGSFITWLPQIWSAVFCLLFTPLLVAAIAALKPGLRLICGFGGAALVFAASFLLFRFGGVYFGPLSPVLALAAAVVIREGLAFVGSDRERQFVRKAFSTYLSGDVVQELISDPSRLQLGGSKREMTAIFTDIQSFSSISEKLDPEDLVRLLNMYLTEMSDIVLANRGTIDKFEGDAIIAFFGAPIHMANHAELACRSAVQMKKAESVFQHRVLDEEGPFRSIMLPLIEAGKLRAGAPLYTRVGINSGDMVVGNMGTDNKMNYTIMGNAVNLAARLEGVNKQYHTGGMLISEYTKAQINDDFLTRPLDRVRVVGINTPLRLYELLGMADDPDMNAVKAWLSDWKAAVECYENRDFAAAEQFFAARAAGVPEDGTAALYLRRCRDLIAAPPGADWDAVNNLTEK